MRTALFALLEGFLLNIPGGDIQNDRIKRSYAICDQPSLGGKAVKIKKAASGRYPPIQHGDAEVIRWDLVGLPGKTAAKNEMRSY
jgi:hypothetical protein